MPPSGLVCPEGRPRPGAASRTDVPPVSSPAGIQRSRTVLGGVELVGRDAELAVVARALADVRGGTGRVLGVVGEAGIGKTALLAALGRATRATPGCWCSRAAAPSTSATCRSAS